ADIAINNLAELAIGRVAPAYLVKCLSAPHGVKPPRKHVALAAIVALPEVRRGFMIDHAGDINRQRFERFDPIPDVAIVWAQRTLSLRGGRGRRLQAPTIVIAGGLLTSPRSACQQTRQPVADFVVGPPGVLASGRDRWRFDSAPLRGILLGSRRGLSR